MGKQIAKCFTKCSGKKEDDLEMVNDGNGELYQEETKEEKRRREQEDRAYRSLNHYDDYRV